MTGETSRLLPALAAAITGIQIGAAIVASRYVIDQTTPGMLALLRYAIGACCLIPVLLATGGWPRFARRDLLPMALLGIVQFGVLVALLNFAVQHLTAARAALLFATFPLLTLLLGAALGRERLSLRKSLGVAATILGVAAVLGEDVLTRGEEASWIGEIAALASAACGAACSVLYRPYLQRYDALPVSAFAMLASVGALGLLAAAEGGFSSVLAFTPAGWAAVIFIGLSSALGYFMWLWALGRLSPTRVTVFVALGPVTATLLGWLLLGEPATLGTWVGLALVALGLWLALRGRAAG